MFQHHGYVSVIQVAIDNDDDRGITFDKYDQDRLDNSFPPFLVFRSILLMGNWTKVLQHSMSRHNMTNPS